MAWTRSSSRSMRRPRAERDSGWGPIADGSDMSEGSVKTLARRAAELAGPVPCRSGDSWLWFAQNPDDLEEAKARCRRCPLRVSCLAGAVERREPCGVWGGEIFDRGAIVAVKRRRGRPHADRRVAARAGLVTAEPNYIAVITHKCSPQPVDKHRCGGRSACSAAITRRSGWPLCRNTVIAALRQKRQATAGPAPLPKVEGRAPSVRSVTYCYR